MERTLSNGRVLKAVLGDITRIRVDAIVNAANSSLVGGGGVDGAIHMAGGPEIMRELDKIRAKTGGCPTGSAVVTGAGHLPAKFVFHAVGPVYRGGNHGEPALLASCYSTCLRLANDHGVSTISFPSISTGVYGYPADEAAHIALNTVARELENGDNSLREVIFVLFGRGAEKAYQAAFSQ